MNYAEGKFEIETVEQVFQILYSMMKKKKKNWNQKKSFNAS